MSEPRNYTPHDRLLKELLRRFLPEFLHLFFPDEAARLNFATLRFVDKELIVNIPEHVVRITDTVAEVETLAGEPEVILVHVELEAGHLHSLPQRMHDYYSLLRMIEGKQVLPLALVLLPGSGGLTWSMYEETLFGRALLRFCYGQVGIRDLSSESYLEQGDPVAAALATLMQPGDAGKAVVKLNALTGVVESQLGCVPFSGATGGSVHAGSALAPENVVRTQPIDRRRQTLFNRDRGDLSTAGGSSHECEARRTAKTE